MTKTLIWAATIICVALILSSGIQAQREMTPIDEPSPAPVL